MSYSVAIVGATGVVGETLISILEEREFPIETLYPLASSNSAGKRLEFREESLKVEDLADFDFSKVQIAFFSAGGAVSEAYAPKAAEAGCVVIDNTAHFRYEEDIPLVVPEVNPHAIAGYVNRNIIANPNCSTIQMVVALAPLAAAFGLKRVIVSTYQSVSGAGQQGIQELSGQVVAMFNQKDAEATKFPHPIAFNCIPAIGSFRADGYSEEEWKLIEESRKILGLPDLKVTPTAVRVPTFACHGESIVAELGKPVTAAAVRRELKVADGVIVRDTPGDNEYPLGLGLAGTDEVFVGRIRSDPFDDHSVAMWVVADNLRKGAAVNAVQIAELVWTV